MNIPFRGNICPFVLLGLLFALQGCADVSYYQQAAVGQYQLLSLRRPLEEALADLALSPELRQRLQTARQLRDFASTELALPDNGSYRNYADVKRPYLVKNVFAAPELSLELRQWCFPILGCVNYRGYFAVAAAERLASELRSHGDDVYLADVPAYSTLGWFDDPLLNTFIHWPAGQLAELLFHELAHQRLFIANDTAFNESFASAVGGLGARLWLSRYGTPEEREVYQAFTRQRDDVLALVTATRDELIQLYASDQSDRAKREGKRRLLTALQERYKERKQAQGGYTGYDRWFQELNNAKLAALNTYNDYVPAFESLFMSQGQDFAAFYRAVEALSKLPLEAREARLQSLMASQQIAGRFALPAAASE